MATWRKSSYSGPNGGNCVEAGADSGRIRLRDTADRVGAVLVFTPAAWRDFAAMVKGSSRP